MKKPRVLVDFIKLAIAFKLLFYKNVIEKLTNNPYFPKPYISLVDALLTVTNLEVAVLAAVDGGHTSTANMRDKEVIADDAFRILASYVNQTANGDDTKISSSGFNQSKNSPPVPKPILTISSGPHPGDVKYTAKASEKSCAYLWQSTTKASPLDSDWKQEGITTVATFEVSGFVPGTLVSFRFAIITADGISEFCVPVSKIIT